MESTNNIYKKEKKKNEERKHQHHFRQHHHERNRRPRRPHRHRHGYSVTLRKAPAAPSDVDKENGMKLRELRKSLGLKQYQFAEKIHRNKNYVSTIEKGRARVSFRYSQAVYEAFRVYPDIKFHEVEKETNNIISL